MHKSQWFIPTEANGNFATVFSQCNTWSQIHELILSEGDYLKVALVSILSALPWVFLAYIPVAYMHVYTCAPGGGGEE